MIELTREYTKGLAARAVPGAYFDSDEKAWVLAEPTPRAAAVALRLFPGIEHDHPELIELRDTLTRDAKPVDYASDLRLPFSAPRVEAAMWTTAYPEGHPKAGEPRHWTLDESSVTPIGASADYQRVDLGYTAAVLQEHGGAYVGWARGLGKTLATAALMDALDTKAAMVVAPNTAKQATWASELEWACPWLTVLVMPNDKVKRERMLERVRQMVNSVDHPFVLVTHYESLAVIAGKGKGKTSVGDGWKKLGITWDLVTADEGHRLANPDAKMTKAIKKIPRAMSLVLSGSVFQNKWEELYGPLSFLFPERYKSRWRDWNDRFLDYVENGYSKVCVGILPDRVEAMRDELGRFMCYREKENLATPATYHAPLTATQRSAYEELQELCLAELEDGTRVKAEHGIAMLTKLRQVATGLDLLSEGIGDSSKLDAAVDIIKRRLVEGDDFVVFVWYKMTASALQARLLSELGLEAWVVTGDVPQKERADMIARFQAGERRVFIGTIPTLGESVNLQRANHVIRIDRSFNPALNQQAVDRVDRQGQEREVYLTDIIAPDTVDELVVMPNLANKSALKAAILGSA
jgi:SNF2 family DNA or RNA helicase